MRPASSVQRPAFFFVILVLGTLYSVLLLTGCHPEHFKRTTQGTDDRAGQLQKRVSPENKVLAGQVKAGTSAMRKYAGEPKVPVTTDEEFDQAIKTTVKQAEKKTSWLGWALGGATLISTLLGIATGLGFIKNVRLRQGMELAVVTIKKASSTNFSEPGQVVRFIKNTISDARNAEFEKIVKKIDPKT